MLNLQDSLARLYKPLGRRIGQLRMISPKLSRNAMLMALCAMTLPLHGCLTAPQPLDPLPQVKELVKPAPTPPASYLVPCSPELPTLPIPNDDSSIPEELVWNTVLVGWSGTYFQCAIRQALSLIHI